MGKIVDAAEGALACKFGGGARLEDGAFGEFEQGIQIVGFLLTTNYLNSIGMMIIYVKNVFQQ